MVGAAAVLGGVTKMTGALFFMKLAKSAISAALTTYSSSPVSFAKADLGGGVVDWVACCHPSF